LRLLALAAINASVALEEHPLKDINTGPLQPWQLVVLGNSPADAAGA